MTYHAALETFNQRKGFNPSNMQLMSLEKYAGGDGVLQTGQGSRSIEETCSMLRASLCDDTLMVVFDLSSKRIDGSGVLCTTLHSCWYPVCAEGGVACSSL
jgi:hypothetical protein